MHTIQLELEEELAARLVPYRDKLPEMLELGLEALPEREVRECQITTARQITLGSGIRSGRYFKMRTMPGSDHQKVTTIQCQDARHVLAFSYGDDGGVAKVQSTISILFQYLPNPAQISPVNRLENRIAGS